MRAPMVTGEGSLPESPLPWAHTKTSCAVTCVWRLAHPAEEVLEHAGVAFDGAERSRPSFLLDQEGIQGPFPADEILLGEGEGGGVGHGGLRCRFAGDTMFARPPSKAS